MNFKNKFTLGFLLLVIMGFILTVPVYAGNTNPCERCIRQCERRYQKDLERCDSLGRGSGWAVCVLKCERWFTACIEECFIDYDHDCDEYYNPGGGGGGGMGTCHYEVETGRCVPYAN